MLKALGRNIGLRVKPQKQQPQSESGLKNESLGKSPGKRGLATPSPKKKANSSCKDVKLCLGNFDIGETLGTDNLLSTGNHRNPKGTFGRVRLSRYLVDGQYYALKACKKSAIIRMKQVEHIRNEVNLLSKIDHPTIVNMLGVFQDNSKLYIVMEYVEGGELFTHLRSVARFHEDQAMVYAAEIVLAFCYLHCQNIVYRDLKPENLLLTRQGRIKIADFGFAKIVEDRTWTLCGTPEYLAPEIIQSKGHGKGVDWWAMGILIHEMIVGYPPFYDDSPLAIYQRILACRLDIPVHVKPKAKDIIKKLLIVDRTRRLGCVKGGGYAVMEHKWFDSIDWDALKAGKVEAPYIPKVSGKGDSSNFESYPDSEEDRSPPLTAEELELFSDVC